VHIAPIDTVRVYDKVSIDIQSNKV